MSLDAIHHELGEACTGARMWGPSAKFAGQRVGREHEVADLDEVEVLGAMRRECRFPSRSASVAHPLHELERVAVRIGDPRHAERAAEAMVWR